MRKILLVSATAAAALSFGLAAPAMAADTTTTFSLTSGLLSVTAPASSALGSGVTGAGNISGALGGVTVGDARGALTATWTATVSTTDFTATGGKTIAKADVNYAPGAATASTGAAAPTAGTGGAMTASQTAFSWAGDGNNSATWNPTISVAAAKQLLAGDYSATITHSIA